MRYTSPYNCACLLALRLSIGSCTVRAARAHFWSAVSCTSGCSSQQIAFCGTFSRLSLAARILSTLPRQLWTATLLLLRPLQSQGTMGRQQLGNQALKAHPRRGHDTSKTCLLPPPLRHHRERQPSGRPGAGGQAQAAKHCAGAGKRQKEVNSTVNSMILKSLPNIW